ncbi:MAG: KH domain-containing protein [Simkaniaceae bacterium]|nr:KH domain-containing protein [Simkaniaceae bacterium]MCF7851610.1 KH domain-containing protein [Simkaniaceae bacterium]
MKEFVEYIVKNLVDHPDKVSINEVGGTQSFIVELSVEKSDIGKIIGKRGKTINAIRTLLMSVASRNGLRVSLEILEDEESKKD